MHKYNFSYIIRIKFLGFRFHGWQKQPKLKTVHDIVDKTLSFVFGHFNFKTIGVGRTDAKVSANNYPLQLFINEEILFDFEKMFNLNAPNDLKIISFEPCSTKFAIINSPKIKTYHYYFSCNLKQDPFSSPLIVSFIDDLDIDLMKIGAKLFEGSHYFNKYCTKPRENAIFKRTIITCQIINNNIIEATFFPAQSFVLIVKGEGFLRHQIKLMMAVLVSLGRHIIDLNYIEESLLENNNRKHFDFIVPSSGLMLHDVEFLE